MELFQANKQWSTRPDDERFLTLQALYDATRAYAEKAYEKQDVSLDSLVIRPNGEEVEVVGKGGVPARISNWAFGQVAKYASAPADFLRELPAEKTADILNFRLNQRVSKLAADAMLKVNLLFHQNGGLLVRAFTSEKYSRFWNWEIAERLLELQAKGWIPAVPTFNTRQQGGVTVDAAGRPVDKSTAIYASDHDLFAFIMHPDRVVKEGGKENGLFKGLIAVNSEVGAAKLRLMRFYYREMCGNHIIWGAEDVVDLSVRHVGDIRGKVKVWEAEIRKYLDSSTSEDEAKIEMARKKNIAGTKDEVLDALFGKRQLGLSRKVLEASYEAVVPEQDGSPNTYWGMAQGLTRYSQTTPYADKRTALDSAAGRIIEMAF